LVLPTAQHSVQHWVQPMVQPTAKRLDSRLERLLAWQSGLHSVPRLVQQRARPLVSLLALRLESPWEQLSVLLMEMPMVTPLGSHSVRQWVLRKVMRLAAQTVMR